MPVTITEDTTSVVSLDELKRHLRIRSADDDYELGVTVGAAIDAVEGIIGPILHRLVTESVTASNKVVALRSVPVVSVTSLVGGGSAITHTLDPAAGVLREVNYGSTLTVTYVAGRTVLPDAVVMAILIIARHLWDLQRGNAPTALPEDDSNPQPGIGYAIPSRAQDLLAPFALGPSVA